MYPRNAKNPLSEDLILKAKSNFRSFSIDGKDDLLKISSTSKKLKFLKSKKIIQSSGHEVLDKQALDMVEKALPFPAPPEVLRGSSFSVKVPIAFKLE